MRNKLIKCLIIIITISALVLVAATAYARSSHHETAIIWIADVSGSVSTVDPQRNWTDTVALGMDLAPSNTNAAFVAVNDGVVVQTPFADVSLSENREMITAAARTVPISGNTDFNAGFLAALEMMHLQPATDRHIFFVADISESGFMSPNGGYAHAAVTLTSITEQMVDSGIKVHLLFMSSPERNQEFMPLWEAMAERTGGSITFAHSGAELARIAETIYFSEFQYNKSVTTAINTAGIPQSIPIDLPAFDLERVRIYISAMHPISGIQFRTDGVLESFSEARSYAMIELTGNTPATVHLTLPPNDNSEVNIYILAEGALPISATVSNEARPDHERQVYRQASEIAIDIETNIRGVPEEDFDFNISMRSPSGIVTQIVDAEYAGNMLIFDKNPQEFGTFAVSLSVESKGIRLYGETMLEITAIQLPAFELPLVEYDTSYTLPADSVDFSIWIAVGIGALLILASIFTAARRMRRSPAMPAPLPPMPLLALSNFPAYQFSGKLDIYGILVDSGKMELPTMSAQLDAQRGTLTLETIFAQAGIPYYYPAAAHIILRAGSENAIEVDNYSDAVIYSGGQAWYKGQRIIIYYGQKMRVVFESDVSEYDVFYHAIARKAITNNHMAAMPSHN